MFLFFLKSGITIIPNIFGHKIGIYSRVSPENDPWIQGCYRDIISAYEQEKSLVWHFINTNSKTFMWSCKVCRVVHSDKGKIKRIPSPTVMSHLLLLIMLYRATHPPELPVLIKYKELAYQFLLPAFKEEDSQIIRLVFRYFSRIRTHSNHLTRISILSISQCIRHLQIIWLVFRYFSRNRTQSNHLTCLLIFLLWNNGMTRLTPMPCTYYRYCVNNHCVIVSSHGTDVKNSSFKFSFWKYRIYTSTWQYRKSSRLGCEAVQHKWCR